jgi:hypothetical protein
MRRKIPFPLTGPSHVLNVALHSQPALESGSAERNGSADRDPYTFKPEVAGKPL